MPIAAQRCTAPPLCEHPPGPPALHPQIAACADVRYVTAADVPAALLEKEKAIEMEKEDIKSKPEQIRWVLLGWGMLVRDRARAFSTPPAGAACLMTAPACSSTCPAAAMLVLVTVRLRVLRQQAAGCTFWPCATARHQHPPHRRPAPCPPRSEKIVQGRVDKIAKEMSLMDQQFIKDTSKTVAVSARAGCCCFCCFMAADAEML